MVRLVFVLVTTAVTLTTIHAFVYTIFRGISSSFVINFQHAPAPSSLSLSAKKKGKKRKASVSSKSHRILKRIALDLEDSAPRVQHPEETWIVASLQELAAAKNDKERQRVASWLAHTADFQQHPTYLELAIQVMALSGQIDLAMSKLNLQTAKNETTFLSIVEGMRCSGRIHDLKRFLQRWNAESCNIEPSVRMLNAFLSAQPSLKHMYQELQQASVVYGVTPDAMSYSIVLQEAAKLGNRTMVDQVWGDMKNAKVAPEIECYNALLRLAETPKEVLYVWDTKIKVKERIRPDPYTIEHILDPLIKSERVSELMLVLDHFVASTHPHAVTNAFTPFLLKLARDGGEVATARLIWEKFILEGRLKPNIRHFNVLLGCYCSLLKEEMDSTALEDAYEAGWGLYKTLTLSQPAIRPDVITLLEMMKFCRSSEELSELFLENLVTGRIRVTETLLRSAITTYGKLGDPSSALWLFERKSRENLKSWNTLLGCLVKTPSLSGMVKPNHSILAERCKGEGIGKTSSLESESYSSAMILRDCSLQTKIEDIFQTMLSEGLVDSQTFCLMALNLQRQGNPSITSASKLYQDAMDIGVEPDGRFLNGILRCFGPNVKDALDLWGNEMRPQITSFYRKDSKELLLNLSAAYSGMFYACGRALRPDMALRLAYAMGKDGLEPDDRCLNTYRTGRRESGPISIIKGRLLGIHESLFEVECSRSRSNWQRRDDKKVRVILSPPSEHDLPLTAD